MKNQIITLVVALLLVGLTSAGFETGNPASYLEKNYALGENLRGGINLKLINEPAESKLESSLGGSIKLFELIKFDSNKGFLYSCNPSDCKIDYSPSNAAPAKTATLNSGGSELYGFKLTGNVTKIILINLTIESNALSDCYNQLTIDLFNDGISDIENKKTNSAECTQTKNAGCFNSYNSLTEGEITGVPYCQKVKLQKTAGIKLGVWVKKISGERTLKMTIYNLTGGAPFNYCDITQTPSTIGGYLSCDISQSIQKPEEYYVCIYSPEGSGTYRTRGYLDSNGCGFNSINVPSAHIAAYDIFAESRQYDSVNELQIPINEQLRIWFEDYLKKYYGNMDCTGDCVIPIKVVANKAQTVSLKNVFIKYDTIGFAGKEDTNLYDLEESQTTITTNDFQKLYVDGANFSVSNNFGASNIMLTLGGNPLLTESIIIKQTASVSSLTPLSIYAGLKTDFYVGVTNPTEKSITNYRWDFGNNSILTSQTNTIKYAPEKIGFFNVTLTITDSEGIQSSKTFEIEAKNPKEILEQTIAEKAQKIVTLKQQTAHLSAFEQTALSEVFDSSQLDASMVELQRKYALANISNKNESYIEVMKFATQLNIPDSIESSTNFSNVPVYMKKENLDLSIISELAGGAYSEDKKDKYENAILKWEEDNLDMKLNYKEFSAKTNDDKEMLFKTFEITVTQKDNTDAIVILKKLSGMHFQNKELLRENENNYYFNLADADGQIIFSTSDESASINNLEMVISPGLSFFNLETPAREREINKWAIFTGLMILIVIFGVIIFMLLRRWYRYNYEDHLFPNKTDMHNLILFIDAEKRKGISDEQLKEKLQKSGWSSEQVKYITKKYSGKEDKFFSKPVDKSKTQIVAKNMQKVNKLRK